MKQNKKSVVELDEYSLILQNNFTSKSSKCMNTKLFALLTCFMSVAALLCLYWTDIESISFDSRISKNYFKWEIDSSANHTTNNYCSLTSDDYKFDCFPRGKANQKSCEERNCCWSPSTSNSQVPWCYYPSNYSNYKVINVTESINGIVAFFNLTTKTNYKDDVKILCMNILFQTAQRLRIKVIYYVIYIHYFYLQIST